MGIIEWGIQFLLDIISGIGYWGIVGLMALESMCLPVPSEIVMPFGGWLAYDGRFDLTLVALAGTLGCVIGSVLAYFIGYYGGRPLICKYGRYIHINEDALATTERWFEKHGALAIFVTRLLPVVRTFVSLPTGIAKYNFWRFVTLSAIGSFIWCYILAYIGYVLGPQWRSIEGSYTSIAIIVVLAVVGIFGYYLYRRRRNRRLKENPPVCHEE
ncbi:MAG: hypothetical protein A4E32_02044 [Methanomassiliicoccales archaeon PtaU1.Bin124]|nr:MAG: hypothetical protein A4E32_02044 [Methanomassiliicoccales archaeon PtaU1.Bin124]